MQCMWETKIKAKHYPWLLAALACLGIPLVASHSPHLQRKMVSRTIRAHMLSLISSVSADETLLEQVKEINGQNHNLKQFQSSLKKKNCSWVALKLSSTPTAERKAALLPISQEQWWLLQLDWHGKGIPASQKAVFFRIRETICFPVGNLHP